MSVPTPILQYNLSDASVKGLLPSGYTPLAYIESTTSNQYIDTGFKYSSGNITVDCEYTVPSNNNATIFGSSNDNTKWLCLIYKSGSNSLHYCGTISGGWANSELSGNKRKITYSISETTCTLNDGKLSVSSSCGTIPAQTYSYTLWCHHYSNTFTQYAQNARIYYFRLVYQGNLTLDYRPARRDSDGVIGMYDLVSRTFKTNSGSGTFIAGPELAVGKGGGKSLPEEYLLVEYLESIGGQHIDTGVKFTNGGSISAKILFTGNYTGTDFGIGNWTSGNRYSIRTRDANGGIYLLYAGGNPASIGTGFNILYDVYLGPSTCKINGTNYNHSLTASDNGTNIFLFAAGGPTRYYSKARIYNVKIMSDSSTTVRNFIPCYRKSDMKPGMYDVVNGVFYTNAGSGEFILGPSITNCYTSEPNAGSGTLLGFYTNLSGIYDSSKGWVADFSTSSVEMSGLLTLLGTSTNFSFAVWFKRSSGGGWNTIWGCAGFELEGSRNGSATNLIVAYSWGLNSSGGIEYTLNEWHHLVMTRNTSESKFYLDGELKYTGSAGSIPNTALFLGAWKQHGSQSYLGQMTNMMLFNTVLTAAQVKELYGK